MKRDLGLQTKLTVNEPGDAYEQEADRVAEAIMGSFSHPDGSRSEVEGEPQSPAESDLTNGGERLAPDVAEYFEARFGHDLSAVRVHTGETAKRYNDAVNAYAFTYGSHIWLGPGLRPRPSHILAHELAHVVQQTQPPPLGSAPGQPDLSPSRQGVQRFAPYWMPEEFRVVGEESHAFILPKIGKKHKIFTEAPVPNAGKGGAAPGFEKQGGIADLCQATNASKRPAIVDVFFAGKKLPKKLSSNPRLFSRLLYRGQPYTGLYAPQADVDRRSVIRADLAPVEILIGDLKPSHGTIEAAEGPDQVSGYLQGFDIARSEVNEMDVGTGGFEQTDANWPPLTTGTFNKEVPTDLKEPIAKGQEARPLKLIHNGKRVDLPRRVMGKVYVRKDPSGGGIWTYTWAPVTRLTAADLPSSVTGLGAEITARIIRPLLVSPVTTAKKAKPARQAPNLTPAPRRIQARAAAPKEEVKDPFDKAAFETWKADHKRLTGEEERLEKTPAFKEAEFKKLVVEERQAAKKSGFNLSSISPEEEKTAKTVDKIRFWTGASSAVFGRLRYWFGGAFVKVFNAYHSIRDRFQRSLEGKNAPQRGGLLGTIIKIAFNVLKIAGRILVGRTAQHLATSLRTGVERKLKALIPEDALEDFEAKVGEVVALAEGLERRAVETVESLVEKTIGPYEGYINTIAEVAETVSKITDVVNKVRWGARVIACLSPPGWGCLWILAESVIEKFASWVIDRCWFKQEIAPLVTRIKFIAELPQELAKIIIKQIQGILPDELHDVFADIDKSKVSTDIHPQEICSENDRDTPARDRFLLEKLALEELRKEIGEEKWEAWTKLADLYGTRRGEPLTEAQVAQLKKELQQASLAALKEAADMYPVLSSSKITKKVTNLTGFLEEVERVKQQMYGGGGGAGGEGGGGAGISIPASEKELAGDYKLGFKFQVVAGVKRGQYPGDVIKVNIANSIRGTLVTLEGVEVVVKSRVLKPNARNPERAEVLLEATKEQYFNVEETHGAEFVNKIGVKRFIVRKGRKYTYTLPL